MFEQGQRFVFPGRGLVQVEGSETRAGVEFLILALSSMKIFLPIDEAPRALRPVVSKEEAERWLAELRTMESTPDDRRFAVRQAALMKVLVKGPDEARVRALQQLYASPFKLSFGERRLISVFEDAIVEEIAHVIERPAPSLVEELHALHSTTGAFSTTAAPRPPDPPPPPPPQAPIEIPDHDFLGAFSLRGDRLVIGDPAYVGSSNDERDPTPAAANVLVAAAAGEWLAYERHDDEEGVVAALVAIHRDAAERWGSLLDSIVEVGDVWVDGGTMAILDASVRDEELYRDAMQFRSDDGGLIEDRGCLCTSGGGDGVYPVVATMEQGRAVVVMVRF